MELEVNSSIDKKKRKAKICKDIGKCPYCPFHDNENKTRYGKHGKTKRKYKNKR